MFNSIQTCMRGQYCAILEDNSLECTLICGVSVLLFIMLLLETYLSDHMEAGVIRRQCKSKLLNPISETI